MLKIQRALITIHMIGQKPKAAPSSAASPAWPTGIEYTIDRHEHRDQQRQQRRPLGLHPEDPKQQKQHDQRKHRKDRRDAQ